MKTASIKEKIISWKIMGVVLMYNLANNQVIISSVCTMWIIRLKTWIIPKELKIKIQDYLVNYSGRGCSIDNPTKYALISHISEPRNWHDMS